MLYSYSKGTPEELLSQCEAGTEDIVSGVTRELRLELSDNKTEARRVTFNKDQKRNKCVSDSESEHTAHKKCDLPVSQERHLLHWMRRPKA